MTRPLVITDRLLFSKEEPEIKVVIAATLGYEKRNPSLTQLAAATGLHRASVKAVQDKLERWRGGTQESAVAPHELTGQALFDLFVAGSLPTAVYDKPEKWHDRNPDNPRFNRSNKMAHVSPVFDPDREVYASLPASILAKLPKGSRSAAVLRLVALVYAREQLIRGAIQVEDEVVARRLDLWETVDGFIEGPNIRQVRRIRENLVKGGMLVVHDADAHPCPIYTMPGATPQRPENPEEFQPEWTKRFHRFGGLDTFATATQADAILKLGRVLGTDQAEKVLVAAGIDPLGDPEGENVIGVLQRVLAGPDSCAARSAAQESDDRRDTYPDTTENLSRDDGDPIDARRRTGQLPLPSTSTSSSDRDADSGTPGAPRSLEDDDSGEGGKASSPSADAHARAGPRHLPRREWKNEHGLTVFCFADDPTFQAIEHIRAELVRKYGAEEAFGLLRTPCYELRAEIHGSGAQVLAWLPLARVRRVERAGQHRRRRRNPRCGHLLLAGRRRRQALNAVGPGSGWDALPEPTWTPFPYVETVTRPELRSTAPRGTTTAKPSRPTGYPGIYAEARSGLPRMTVTATTTR